MRRLTAALLLLIALAAACDSPTTISPRREGTLTGTLNGQAWEGTASSSVYRDAMYIHTKQSGGPGEQWITVSVVPNGQGGYSVLPAGTRTWGSHYGEVIGGDVLTYSAPITQGTINLTEYSATRVKGSLQLTFSGSRGVWQFSGQFDAPRQDVD